MESTAPGLAPLPVTALYASLLALLFLVLSARVVLGRAGPGRPSLGDGGDPAMLRRIRGHANFAEYVPLALILIALLEGMGVPRWELHALGGALLAGRVLHGYALSFTSSFVFGRSAGIGLTFAVLAVAALHALWIALVRLSL